MPSPPSPAEPWIHEVGARRGRYEVTKRIARGGYGEVYAVRDEAGAPWAMKLLRLAHAGDHRAAERALLEATLLKRIDHVNVVGFQHAFVERDGTVVLVTELLQGALLRTLLALGALPVDRALRFGRQLADAAAAVHAVGAVHRDIKPENVFVTRDETVKLFDFGLAKYEGVALKTTRALGTPRYLAPDQLAYRPSAGAQPDPRWDVYAVGLVVFEMLAGGHPFDLDAARAPRTAGEVIERHLEGSIPPLREVMPGLPSALSDAIARAVQRQPERRTASASVLAAELGAARAAWKAAHGDDVNGVTAELRRRTADALDDAPDSLDGPTLERPRPPGPFGTEPLLPHVNLATLAARNAKPTRNR